MNLDWKYFSMSAYCEWMEWFRFGRGYNWINFHIINVEFEYEKHGPSFELTLVLIGFYLRFALCLPWTTEQSEEIRQRLDDIKLATCAHCGKYPFSTNEVIDEKEAKE